MPGLARICTFDTAARQYVVFDRLFDMSVKLIGDDRYIAGEMTPVSEVQANRTFDGSARLPPAGPRCTVELRHQRDVTMDVADLLAAWRAAQAVLEGTEPGSEEHRAADEACREAANAYQRHVAEHADKARELGAWR